MKKAAISIMLALVLLPAAAQAQQRGSIKLKNIAEVEIVEKNAKGEKAVKRADASKAKVAPGDTVIFTTTYTNIGKQPATDVVITNPVPEHMLYADKTAEGKGTRIEFSTDGGKTYAAPDKLMVKDAKGIRKAGPADYTHIKWTLNGPLAAGSKGSVSFRARVK